MRIYCNAKNTDRNGRTELFFKVKSAGRWRAVMTGIKIQPHAWDQEGQQALKGRGVFYVDKINTKLQQYTQHLEQLAADYNDIDKIRALFEKFISKSEAEKSDRIGFIELLDHLQTKYKSKYAHNYIRALAQVKNHVQDFMPDAGYSDMTADFWRDYTDYLLEKGLANSTIRNHAKMLRFAMREAQSMDIHVPPDFGRFTWTQERSQPIWLSWSEVGRIKNLRLTGTIDRIRDSFLFRCYTGLRHSDLLTIINIKGNTLQFEVYKTKKPHTIKLNKLAHAIVKKHKGTVPVYSQQYENAMLKTICTMAGLKDIVTKVKYSGSSRIITKHIKRKIVSTHTARRTFARHWLEQGGSIVTLSKYLGHSSVAVTQQYVGYSDGEIDNEMLRLFD
jgi:integrase